MGKTPWIGPRDAPSFQEKNGSGCTASAASIDRLSNGASEQIHASDRADANRNIKAQSDSRRPSHPVLDHYF
jgi:hypothetical protein